MDEFFDAWDWSGMYGDEPTDWAEVASIEAQEAREESENGEQ
jgi:hypothetical protein